MKRILAISLMVFGIPAFAQTACAPPAQTVPNFSSATPYTITSGSFLPVVWLPSSTAGCTTYFTVDGTTPSTSSPVYTGQTIQLTKTTVILMIAIGSGKTSSQQWGGQWLINMTGTTPPPPSSCGTPTSPPPTSCAPGTSPCVALSCTSSSTSGTTSSIFKSIGTSSVFAPLVSGLLANCTYIDSAVSPGQTYSYYAEALKNGLSSIPSNTCTVTIPAVVVKPVAPTLAIIFSPTSITDGTSVTATITVTGTTIPSGSVILTSGAYTSASTVLVNGVATIQIPANSLDVGILSFTASYTPDTAGSSTYTSTTGTGSLTVTPAAPTLLTGTTVVN